MKKFFIPSAQQIVEVNNLICTQCHQKYHCYDVGKIESAIHTAFYPGHYPFVAGGVVQIAAALCYYLVKSHAFLDGNKRTAVLTAISFLNKNGWDLRYPTSTRRDENALATVIEKCAAGEVSKEELINWFEVHKIRI